MTQIITKNGAVVCTRTFDHYTPEVVKQMKKAGYKVTTKNKKEK